MNSHSLYDKALQILQECFAKNESLKNAKEQSQNALFTLLQSNPDSENDIRLAILHFYDQCGLGCFVHYDKNQLQIITRIKNHTYNIYVQRICDFLKKHKNTLYEKEPSKEDLKNFFDFVDSTLDIQCQNTKKDIIRVAIRNVFRIQPRDGLFFKDGNITLKKFDYEMVQTNHEIRDMNNKMHMNVLNVEYKKRIDKALESINIQSLIMQNTLQILQDDIHLTQIDNIQFNQQFYFFSVRKLRVFLETLPLEYIDSASKTMYCMNLAQQYAWVIFEVVAKELLDLCMQEDKNAIAFIHFYNGGSIKLDGNVYTKPLIIDKNGNPWTLPSIQEILYHKRNVEFDIQNIQKQIDNLQQHIHHISSTITQDEIALKLNTTKLESCNNSLEAKNKTLRLLVDKKSQKDKIDTLSKEINTIILDKSQILTDIEKLQKNINALNEEYITYLSSQKKLQEQVSYALKKNKDCFLQYDLLLRALADAIANGKELV